MGRNLLDQVKAQQVYYKQGVFYGTVMPKMVQAPFDIVTMPSAKDGEESQFVQPRSVFNAVDAINLNLMGFTVEESEIILRDGEGGIMTNPLVLDGEYLIGDGSDTYLGLHRMSWI